jgi:hypothetical protein
VKFASSFIRLRGNSLAFYGTAYICCEGLALLLLIAQWILFGFLFGPTLSALGTEQTLDHVFPLVN